MRFAPEALHGANNGLAIARGVMEEVKKEFPWISYGDLWTLGGVAAIQEMGGPKIPWRPGRIDGYEKDATPDGRLPDATQAQDHLRKVSRGTQRYRQTCSHSTTADLLPDGIQRPRDRCSVRCSRPGKVPHRPQRLRRSLDFLPHVLHQRVLQALTQREVSRSKRCDNIGTDASLLRWSWRKWGGPKQYADKTTGTLMMLPYVAI